MKLKKFTSVMLMLALVLVMISPVCALAADPVVGILTIFAVPMASSVPFFDTGHAWISFKCTTWPAVEIGGLSVSVNCEVTLGTFGNISQHVGMWYNVESYIVNHSYYYLGRVSLSMQVTRSQVAVLNNIIDQYDYWSSTINCASFAEAAWNAVSADDVDAGLIDNPGDLSESIMSYEHYEEMRPVVYNSTIGYVVGARWYSYNPVIATNATNESTSSTGE